MVDSASQPAAQGGSATPVPPAAPVAGDGAVVIDRPAAGMVTVFDPAGARRLRMKFNFAEVKVVLLDVDVVLVFQDGSKIILPGFGLEAMSADPPPMTFEDREVVADELIRSVEDVKLLDQTLSVQLTNAPVQNNFTGEGDGEGGPPRQVAAPIQVLANDFTSRAVPTSAPLSLTQLNAENPEPALPSGSPPRPFNPFDDGRIGNIIGLEMQVRMYTPTAETAENNTFVPGFAAPGAESNASYAAQAAPPSQSGTASADTMGRADAAVFQRIVELKPDFPIQNTTVSELTVSGLPDGYSVVGKGVTDLGGGVYRVAVDQSGGAGTFRFTLQYPLPPDGLDPTKTGFYDDKTAGYTGRFTAVVTFTGATPNGPVKASGGIEFGVRDANGEGDMVFTDPATKAPVVVLWANPPGVALRGLGGNDTLYASGGRDTIDGGEGLDIVSYAASVSAVSVALGEAGAAAAVSGGAARGDVLTNVEGVTGSEKDDTLTGNSGDNQLSGRGGRDLLTGGRGDDTLDGGSGNDTLDAGAGNDSLIGGVGADSMAGGEGDDTYDVDNAGDVIVENPGSTGGTDRIVSNLTSLSLSDPRYANVENLTAVLREPSAFYGGGNGLGNLIDARDPFVTSATLEGFDGADTLYGSGGDDSLDGGAQNDLLVGGKGNDTLRGGTGADTMQGGDGNDLYFVDDTGDVVTELSGSAAGSADEIRTTLDSLSLADNVERLTAVKANQTGFTGTGNTLDNVLDASALSVGADLDGGIGTDTLKGGSGADTLRAADGADSLVGGKGDDLYIVTGSGVRIVEQAGGGADTIQTSDNAFTIQGSFGAIEALVFNGSGPFSGQGNTADNSLHGGSGKELLDVQASAYSARRSLVMNLYESQRAAYGILHSIGRFIPAAVASAPR